MGLLLGKEDQAQERFQQTLDRLAPVLDQEGTGKTVAFFYITSNGGVNVRKPGDYISKLIGMAGGEYVFQDLGGEENALSTMNLQMEAFYAGAKDADLLIYNSAVDGGCAPWMSCWRKMGCWPSSGRYRRGTSGVPGRTCSSPPWDWGTCCWTSIPS